MNATAQYHPTYASQFRWLAHTSAEILVVLWIGFFAAELVQPGTTKWPADLFLQGGLLAVVFAGYAIGWRKEVLGGWMAILGTAAFIIQFVVTQNAVLEVLNMAWFAVPGVLYLLAHHYDRRSFEQMT